MAEKGATRRHVPVLGSEQIEAFRAQGFLVVKGVFDQAPLARLVEATAEFWEQARSLRDGTAHFDIDPDHDYDTPKLRRISSPTEISDVYREIAFDSALGDVAADLVGGPVKFYHSKVNFKLPRGGAEIAWHQDWPVFPHTNTNLLAISVPMTPSRRENGCLRVLAGSHKGGPRSHWENGVFVLNCNGSLSQTDLDAAIYVEADPGDLVVHHGLVVHGSEPNRSDQIRTTFIVQYAAADAFAYTAPVIDSRHRGQMVRGEAPRHARVESGAVELPPDYSGGYSSIYAHQGGEEKHRR